MWILISFFIGEKTPPSKLFVVIVCDATFYGKKKDKLGTLVFKDIIKDEILIWKHIDSEKVFDYKQLLQMLLDLGYIIKSVTIDGKRGLYKVFKK